MKDINRFQKFFYRSFRVFGIVAVIAFILILLARLVAPSVGMGIYPLYGLAALVWMASASFAVLSLIMLTQNRPLHHSSLLVNALSIAGITLLVLAGLYVAFIYGLALTGAATVTPYWALASYWVKVMLIVGAILLYAALLFSYKPLRRRSTQLIAMMCAIATGVFTFWDLGDYSTPDIYRPFALLFGTAAFFAMISVINASKPPKVESKQA